MDKKQEPRQASQEGQLHPTAAPPQEQLIPKKGEEYLSESGNIEDMPNPEEVEEAEGGTGE